MGAGDSKKPFHETVFATVAKERGADEIFIAMIWRGRLPDLNPRGRDARRYSTARALNLQHLSSLRQAGRGAAVLAGGDSGERHQLTPAEGRARGGEFFGHGAVVFLGVERAVFAHGVA